MKNEPSFYLQGRVMICNKMVASVREDIPILNDTSTTHDFVIQSLKKFRHLYGRIIAFIVVL
jgi:ATP-dependent Clp protease adapter protein ClpS